MRSHRIRWSTGRLFWRIGLAALAVATMVILSQNVFLIPSEPLRLSAEFQDPDTAETLIAQSGVGNLVTAVLLNYRAYDTLLELVVMLLALLGVQATVTAAVEERKKPSRLRNPLLAAAVGIIVPVSFIVAGDLLWSGADHPGGAFQAGAVLGGAGIVLLLAGRWHRLTTRQVGVRCAAVAGATTFLVIGTGRMLTGGHFLEFPAEAAQPLILTIEAATAVSIAVLFVLLFEGVCGTVDLDEPDCLVETRGDSSC
jgi:multisubunit Na+/H+ antiporter MnhB subunit